MKKILPLLIIHLICVHANAQKIPKFGADLGMKTILRKDIRIPYTSLTSYYGYIKPGSKPDEVKGGKNYYYVYLWIPIAAPEIGIRMISPIPSGMAPEADDFKSVTYDSNKTENTNFFDTWVTLERAVNIVSINDITTKLNEANWVRLGYNDDSGELPEQPSGNPYNSVMRVTSTVSDPLHALTVGLYRIGFTTFKTGEVEGGFVAQIGAPVKLPGVKVSATATDLVTQ